MTPHSDLIRRQVLTQEEMFLCLWITGTYRCVHQERCSKRYTPNSVSCGMQRPIMHCLAIEYLGSMFDTKSGRASSRGGVFVPKCITCNISMFFDVPETTTALLFQAWNQAQTDVTPDFWTSEY